MPNKFPEKKDDPRKFLFTVVLTYREREALRREAAAQGISGSDLGRNMLIAAGLPALVEFYFPSDAAQEPHTNGNSSAGIR